MTRPPAPPRHLPPPELFSYDGPPQGDYVRYVEQLMAWAEREHARSAASTAPSASASIAPQSGARPPGAVPLRADAASATGAVAPQNSVADIVRQVSARLQEQAQAAQRAPTPTRRDTSSAKKPTKAAPVTIVFMLALVALFIFVPDLAPLAIVLWVVWNIFRLLRAVNGGKSGKSGKGGGPGSHSG